VMREIDAEQVVNVRTVPLRSPFRFPGGKTWLVPRIRQWMSAWRDSHGGRPAEFIEAFAGGAIVGLTVAFEGLADHVVATDIDDDIASVWQTILDEDTEVNARWLAGEIMTFEPTRMCVEELLSRNPRDRRDLAFRTLVRNRVNRGGIMAPGAGMLRRGEAGKGLRSRWYPETLARRILAIADARELIEFRHEDGLRVIREYQARDDVVFFIDPPYTTGSKQTGRRLYAYSNVDHDALFEVMGSVAGDFVMTYSNTDGAQSLAERHGFETLVAPMKNTHHARSTELVIGRDLHWVRHTASP